MLSIISPAKTFAKKAVRQTSLLPHFGSESLEIAQTALCLSEEELGRQLKVNAKIAHEVRHYWQSFVEGTAPRGASLAMYSGMVFKKINAQDFDEADWHFAQEHLRICSFAYGMLSPEASICPYRMEGAVRTESGARVFDYWRDKLTPYIIGEGQARGGTLINLASDEMQQLFHWSRVREALRLVNIIFVVRQADGTLKSIVIYCKMARGAMMRAIIKGRIDDAEALKELRPEGFVYSPEHSTESDWVFVLGT